ncbi:MAG: hypothetical protein D6820_14145, partial [Lentisphaerae bacterium]
MENIGQIVAILIFILSQRIGSRPDPEFTRRFKKEEDIRLYIERNADRYKTFAHLLYKMRTGKSMPGKKEIKNEEYWRFYERLEYFLNTKLYSSNVSMNCRFVNSQLRQMSPNQSLVWWSVPGGFSWKAVDDPTPYSKYYFTVKTYVPNVYGRSNLMVPGYRCTYDEVLKYFIGAEVFSRVLGKYEKQFRELWQKQRAKQKVGSSIPSYMLKYKYGQRYIQT